MRRSSAPPHTRRSSKHSSGSPRKTPRAGAPQSDAAPEHPRYCPFTARVIEIIRAVPRGKVATYAQVAGIAGSPLAARQVVRILHTLSRRERLPWHRIINSAGSIALHRGAGFEEQRTALRSEGVKVRDDGKVDIEHHLWVPRLEVTP